MIHSEVTTLDNVVKIAQIVGPLFVGGALIIAVFAARPYKKKLGFAIKQGYNIQPGNTSDCAIYLTISNMSLVPIIIEHINIKFKNKKGSYFDRGDYPWHTVYALKPGTFIENIPIEIFAKKRKFKNEYCKAKIVFICRDTAGKKYKSKHILENDFTQHFKSE